jgi:hypothetical protein
LAAVGKIHLGEDVNQMIFYRRFKVLGSRLKRRRSEVSSQRSEGKGLKTASPGAPSNGKQIEDEYRTLNVEYPMVNGKD